MIRMAIQNILLVRLGFPGGLIVLALVSTHMPAMILVLKEPRVAAGKYDNNSVTSVKNTNIK
jgi:hypothetical protein